MPASIDARRQAIELRMKQAKERLLMDLSSARNLVKQVASGASTEVRQTFVRVAAVAGGMLLLGLVTALVRRRRRRLYITWR